VVQSGYGAGMRDLLIRLRVRWLLSRMKCMSCDAFVEPGTGTCVEHREQWSGFADVDPSGW
jgi:hypothetical protein